MEDEVPFLLSIRFEHQAKADLAENRLHLQAFGHSGQLQQLPTGHVAISVLQFAPNEFHISPVAVPAYNFMFTWRVRIECKCKEAGQGVRREARAHDSDRAIKHWHQTMLKVWDVMAPNHTESVGRDGAGKGHRKGLRLARKWLHAWIALVVSCHYTAPPASVYSYTPGMSSVPQRQGDDLCGDHQGWQLPGTSKVQTSPLPLAGGSQRDAADRPETAHHHGEPGKSVQLNAPQLPRQSADPRTFFWKCPRRICDFFEWGPEKIHQLQNERMKREEVAKAAKAKEIEEILHKEKQELVTKTMEVAEERRQTLM